MSDLRKYEIMHNLEKRIAELEEKNKQLFSTIIGEEKLKAENKELKEKVEYYKSLSYCSVIEKKCENKHYIEISKVEGIIEGLKTSLMGDISKEELLNKIREVK